LKTQDLDVRWCWLDHQANSAALPGIRAHFGVNTFGCIVAEMPVFRRCGVKVQVL